ncbi:MAG: hypothetical protein P4L99_23840 [Chthoniobacter sp.]|nr:hypothetical protein [Chthoniobacter sp.]
MKLLALLLIVGLLLFVACRRAWYRRRVTALFSQHTGDPPTLADVQDRLSAINLESRALAFTAIRHANILVREHPVSLVFGPVGGMGFAKNGLIWRWDDSIFAIAEKTEIPWFLANPDLFTQVFIGSRFAIFWPAISKL